MILTGSLQRSASRTVRTASPISSASTLASDAIGAALSCDDPDQPGNLRIVARPIGDDRSAAWSTGVSTDGVDALGNVRFWLRPPRGPEKVMPEVEVQKVSDADDLRLPIFAESLSGGSLTVARCVPTASATLSRAR